MSGNNSGGQPSDPQYVELPTRDAANPDSPALGAPETPRMGDGFQDASNRASYASPGTPGTPSATDPLYLSPFSPTGGERPTSINPAPSFMSMGTNRHDSYMSMGSAAPFADSRRDSYASGTSGSNLASVAEDGNRPRSALGPSPLAAGAGLTAAGAAAGAGAGSGWRTSPDADDMEMSEKPRWMGGSGSSGRSKGKKWLIIGGVIAAVLVALGVGLGVGLSQGLKNSNANSSAGGQVEVVDGTTTTRSATGTSTAAAAQPTVTRSTNGGDGSKILLSNGTEITYANRHGGTWAYDPYNPLLYSARPNNWTAPLNEAWDWDQIIYGVNLGGWFVTEPFICPGLYEAYPNGTAGVSVDEYTMSENMGDQLESAMTEHYETFITEEDFMKIADAGLSWIRLPIGFWAIETIEGEPYLKGVSWKYIVQALQWAKKYGLRVNLDLHAVPGSQNGWNHSGKIGSTNWMNGVMGIANLQRSIEIIHKLLEFIIQPEWKDVVLMFGIMNEPRAQVVSHDNLAAFYQMMHDTIREVTGYGGTNGPMISIFEGFEGVGQWYGFGQGQGTGLDRVMLDVHQYTIFQDQDMSPLSVLQNKGCSWWAQGTLNTMNQFGTTNTGEWSLALNDCGQWLNGVNLGTRAEGTYAGYTGPVFGPDYCEYWMRPETWNQSTIDAMRNTWLAGEDALKSNFFWTWNIGPTTTYANPSPAWSYKLGLEMGWITHDPRVAEGYCASEAAVTPTATFTGYQPFMTGGATGPVPSAIVAAHPWPITTLQPSFNAAQMSQLPQYTRTGSPLSVATPTYSDLPESVSAALAATTSIAPQPAFTPISGCSYPNEYNAADLPVPTSACGAGTPNLAAAMVTAAPAA